MIANLEGPGRYRAWSRQGARELFWPEVEVAWEETRSVERARRDVPVLWRIESADGRLEGQFEAASSHVQLHDGDGAILPVLRSSMKWPARSRSTGSRLAVSGSPPPLPGIARPVNEALLRAIVTIVSGALAGGLTNNRRHLDALPPLPHAEVPRCPHRFPPGCGAQEPGEAGRPRSAAPWETGC